MAPSAKSSRIGYGVAHSAFKLQRERSAADDSLLTKISTTEGERPSAGGPDREAPATPSADALDAEWDAVIDAATD